MPHGLLYGIWGGGQGDVRNAPQDEQLEMNALYNQNQGIDLQQRNFLHEHNQAIGRQPQQQMQINMYRRPTPQEALLDLASNWFMENLEIREIVVSEQTFTRFHNHLIAHNRVLEMDDAGKSMVIATVMGYIKITCRPPVFNLDKYMETVE